MKKLIPILLTIAAPLFGQVNQGELHLKVTDPAGLGTRVPVHLVSQASNYDETLSTNNEGRLNVPRLPYGLYRMQITQPGYATLLESLDIHSSIAISLALQLQLSSVQQSVIVTSGDTLIDPDQAGSVSRIGGDLIDKRLGSVPGRSVQDLVNTQPGWLYEGNAVLHPRGSEYQTQFVVDGIPLTDNRSPGLGPEIEADDVESMSVYTAGIPAEYGRKMGGVVEINTLRNTSPGFHGQVQLSGGSFETASSFAQGQAVWGKNTLGGSASGGRTSRYLNPVVPENFSNSGTQADFSLHFQRDLTSDDSIGLSLRHEIARYDIPNELLQQAAGQRQTAGNIETIGIASWQHILSANATVDLHGMVRDNSGTFQSNPQSTPIELFQSNGFREGYLKGAATLARHSHEFKFGFETDNTFLRENTRYHITDSTQYDPGTPLDFAFAAHRPDLEQSVFAQDLLHLHHWTISGGLRWDHYQLLLNRNGLQPRLSVSRFLPGSNTVLHLSYDRVFQTPSFANLLLSSSAQVQSISPTNFYRLPVQPSHGDYYEAGFTSVVARHLKFSGNYFRRWLNNYADDDQIANTSVSFPISFRKAILYGAEGKVDIPEWRHLSGYASYSWIVGNVWLPVTGGLFLGDAASSAVQDLNGHFPDSQDQRNTVRARLRYQAHPRLWFAGGLQSDSGLPFQFGGDPSQALAQYGQAVLNRLNFDRGRIRPSLQFNASAGLQVFNSDRVKMNLQADGENLNNVLDVIDFGGLFSGNAIGPPRSFSLRLSTTF